MTDSECEQVYQELIEVLKHHQLLEVISRVEEQIAEGKIAEENVKTLKEALNITQEALFTFDSLHSNMKQSSTVPFSIVTPYTAKERLEILLETIEQEIVTPAEIAIYLNQAFLPKYSFSAMTFTSELGESVKQVHREGHEIQSLRAFTDQLRSALLYLRKEL